VRRYYYDANDRLLEMSDSLHAAENFAYEMRLKRD
jgi:YD repeat-containing protein